MDDRIRFRFPSVLLQFLDAYFEPENGPDQLQQMLDELGVTQAQFRDAGFQFNGEHLYQMLEMLRRNSPEEPPVLRVLRHLSLSNMGMAGIAGLTALTFREAYDVAIKFYKVIMPVLELESEEHDEVVHLKAGLLADFAESQPVLTELILGALKQFSDEATGVRLDFALHFAHAPQWGADTDGIASLYREFFQCDVLFNAPESALVIRKQDFDRRLKNPNKILHSYARNVVDEELAQNRRAVTLTEKVRRILVQSLDDGTPLSLEEVAASLHMTSRTLARKLARENAQYKSLLNDVRFEKAEKLLRARELSVKQIASRLGFTNADAFSRAFKKHAGVTPNQWTADNG